MSEAGWRDLSGRLYCIVLRRGFDGGRGPCSKCMRLGVGFIEVSTAFPTTAFLLYKAKTMAGRGLTQAAETRLARVLLLVG